MQEGAFIGGVAAGLIYLVASVRLIRLSWRSQKSPEFLLGVSLLLWAISYAGWQIPIATSSQLLTQPLFFASRILDRAGTICFSYFVFSVFRNQVRWARYFVVAIAICIFAGVAGSIAVGDWEGMRPLHNPCWWLDWAATLAPMIWIGIEGFNTYAKLKRRVQLGLCEPLVCNRFLLWGTLGVVWTVYYWALAYQTIDTEINQMWSSVMDRAFSTLDSVGVAVIWLAFFPPRFYQRWIERVDPRANVAEA
jgi:hypothetical protein